jgi:nucleoid-associated protein YgaU
MRLLRALLAAGALTGIVVGPPWALIRYLGNPWPAEGVSLSAPLTDGAIIGLLALVVWVLWIQLVVCIVAETVAALTDDRIRFTVPFALGIQQHLARRLVTTVVVATVATPIALAASASSARSEAPTPTTADHTAPAAPAHPGPAHAVRRHSGHLTATAESNAPGQGCGPTTTVTVMRLDSLWSIAERHLDDGNRWPEIAALNEGRRMNDGRRFAATSSIQPGWELLVPDQSGADGPWSRQTSDRTQSREHASERTVTVEPGDTLSEIAHDELGDAQAYPELFAASSDILQPDGAHLSDPDLIQPGWTIVIPDTSARHHSPGQGGSHDEADANETDSYGADASIKTEPHGPRATVTDVPRPRADGVAPTPPSAAGETSHEDKLRSDPSGSRDQERSSAASPDTTEPSDSTQVDEVADELSDELTDPTVLSSLLATAACLAAGAAALLARNRRKQLRARRFGRTIATTPPHLADTEQAILEHGPTAQDDVTFLDRALRHVSATCRASGDPLPHLGAVALGRDDLTLLFRQPATAPVPHGWTATDDARAWALARATYLEDDLDTQPAPYPALVSIGQDDAERTWLIDLEAIGMCGIRGYVPHVTDLIRFIVAELAVNAWSDGAEVLLADGFAAEPRGVNPIRLRLAGRTDALARATVLGDEAQVAVHSLGADLLTRRRDGVLLDTTHPVVIVTSAHPGSELDSIIGGHGRSRIAVLHADATAPTIDVTADGTAYLPEWGITLRAFALPAEEAEAMSALVAATRNLADKPVPDTQTDDGPLGSYARADGSLREEYVQARHTEGGDSLSMLPEPDAVYVATAATTVAELAAAAPSIPQAVRTQIATLDPTLDSDLADWFDESCPRPKVHLLGPVEVTALHGGDPSAIDNVGATVSFIAFLACQDRGVTGERAAAACGWKTQRTVQNRATNARFLLGTRPDGSDWLPDASISDGARRGSSPTYELTQGTGGVLSDADLFIRLRNRAQRRGELDGCEDDLTTALSLVTGAPFEAAAEHRFRWLYKPGQQRHDEILVAAIHDTAHLLATRAIVVGRTDLVRLACAVARTASPHSDVAWLDEAAAVERDHGAEAAATIVRDHVLDSFDEELPARSETIVDQRKWATG